MPIEFGIDEIDYQYTKSREQGSLDSEEYMTDAEKKSAREALEDTIWKSLVNRY